MAAMTFPPSAPYVCPNCQKTFAAGAKACVHCGTSFVTAVAPVAPVIQPPITKTGISDGQKVGIGCVVALLVAFLAISTWNQLRLADDRARIDAAMEKQRRYEQRVQESRDARDAGQADRDHAGWSTTG